MEGKGGAVSAEGGARFVRVALGRPGAVLAFWALLAVVAGFGVVRLKIETAPSSFLDKLSPEWNFYQESLDRFGGDEIIVLAIEGEEPFAPDILSDVARLTAEFQALPGVRRVDSLSSVPIVRLRPDGVLDLSPALADPVPEESETAARAAFVEKVEGALVRDRIVPGSLVSAEGRAFAINVLLEAGAEEEQSTVVEAALAATEGPRAWASGVPIYEHRVGQVTGREILTFVPATLGLMGLLLWLGFGSWVAVFIPALTSGLGAWVTLGVMGAVGEPITLTGMILPSVLLALGCAYVMHILVAARGVSGNAALERALAPVMAPIAVSGLTTAVGFFALMTIRIDAIRGLGGYGGIGVLVVMFAALTVAPALLSRFPLPEARAPIHGWIRARLGPGILGFLDRRRVAVMLAWAGLLVVSTVGVARVRVETDAVKWWPPGSSMRNHYDAIRDRLSGISPMNVVIDSTGDRRVIEPAVISQIDALSTHLEGHPDVGKVLSVSDPLRQLHGEYSDDPTQPLPDRAPLIAQYLLLLDSVDPIHDAISFDRYSANVLIRANDNGSRALLDIAEDAEAWWAANGDPEFDARVTGIMYEFARSEEAIAWGQVRGLTLALMAIGLVLFVLFRDLKVVAVALVPNLASLAVIYGFMGLAGIPLDGGTVCMGTLALGIAVDDTIHVVSGYRFRHQAGLSSRESMARTFDEVLPALIYTTVAIGLGFAVLGFSEFLLTRNLGLVTSVMVAICLVADTTLLPAVLQGEDDLP